MTQSLVFVPEEDVVPGLNVIKCTNFEPILKNSIRGPFKKDSRT